MDNGDYEASFRLSIKNSGNKTFKANEGYWHVYFENSNEISYIGGAESFTTYGEKTHQRDIINLPIYPGSFLDIGPEYKYIFKKVGEGPGNLNPKPIRYFFETDYGYFPKSVKMDPKTGAVLYNNMGSIFFEMP